MGIADVARGMDGGLPDAGRRALELLLADPAGMSKLSAAQVAEQVGVHETTLTRLATRLGFSGYRQFRAALAHEGNDPVSSVDRMRTRSGHDYTFTALVADEVAALERAAQVVDQADIDALARTVLEASRVFLFGPPYAQQVNALLARRLRRLGLSAEVLPTSGRLIAEHLTAFTGEDMLISFVLRRPDPRLARINSYVKSCGAAVAVIADSEGHAYDPKPDHLIVAPRGPRSQQRSLIVPMTLVYALQFAITHAAPERSAEALHRLDDLARLVGDDEPSHWG